MKFSDLKLTTPYLELDALFYDKVEPTPLVKPFLIAVSQDAAELLDIEEDLTQDVTLVQILNDEKNLRVPNLLLCVMQGTNLVTLCRV